MNGFAQEWCEWSEGPSGGHDSEWLFGTRVCVLLILSILQLLVVIYLFKHVWHGAMDTKLKWCLIVYHVTLSVQYIIFLSAYLEPVFSSNSNDLNTSYWCYTTYMFNYLLPSIYLSIFIIFWNFRLNTVFNNSCYQVPKWHNYVIYIWAIAGVGSAYIIVIVSLIQATNSNINESFCVRVLKIVDFVPYLVTNQQWTNIDNFLQCALNSNFNIAFVNVYTAGISIVTLNIVISVEYLRKMYQLFDSIINSLDENEIDMKTVENNSNETSNTSNQTNSSEKKKHGQEMKVRTQLQRSVSETEAELFRMQQRQQMFRNGIIAIGSNLSSLIAYCVYALVNTHSLVILVWLDWFVNGLLMLAVFQFGNWIFDYLCMKCCCFCCRKLCKCTVFDAIFENTQLSSERI